VRSWLGHGATETAAALAFFCAFSLAPLLVIVLAVAGRIIGETAAFGFVHAQLQMLFGASMAGVVVEAMQHAQRPEGKWAAIASVITLVVGATTVFDALEKSLERILDAPGQSRTGMLGWLRRRVLSMGFILALSFLLLVSLTVSTAIGGLRSWASARYSPLLFTIGVLELVATMALMTMVFAAIYRYMPSQRLRWQQVICGGLLTAVLFNLGKWGVGLYLARSTVPDAFGAAASFAALLLWLYYTAMIFLLGAEFTACIGKSVVQVAPAVLADEQRTDDGREQRHDHRVPQAAVDVAVLRHDGKGRGRQKPAKPAIADVIRQRHR